MELKRRLVAGFQAVVSYVKAVFLMKNKQVFDVTKLDVDKYAK